MGLAGLGGRHPTPCPGETQQNHPCRSLVPSPKIWCGKLCSADPAFACIYSEFRWVLVWEFFEHVGVLVWVIFAQTTPEQDSKGTKSFFIINTFILCPPIIGLRAKMFPVRPLQEQRCRPIRTRLSRGLALVLFPTSHRCLLALLSFPRTFPHGWPCSSRCLSPSFLLLLWACKSFSFRRNGI